MADAVQNRERDRLLGATANRLRLIQADFADETEQVRRDYLADEIQRALSALVPEERGAFLKELADRFPTWDQKVDISNKSAAPVQGAMDLQELRDPSFLVSRLLELAPQLSPMAKDAITSQLRKAGLAPAGGSEFPADVVAATRPKLQLQANETPVAANILELAGLLAEFAASLDQLIWQTWRTISPRTKIGPPRQMLKTLGRFAIADRDTPRGQVTQDLERTRQAVAAIISAISQTSKMFAHNYAAKYAPAELEALTNIEGGWGLGSKEAKNWKRYAELVPSKDAVGFEAAIENEIRQGLADYAEALMRGLASK
ncbi:MAG: hypothetical protein ABSH20_11510 [Tepidisphaeraceae bacterium]